MGIYVMSAKALKELLINKYPKANDFGNEIIPGAREAGYKVQAFAFEGYWEDIGTIEAFYNCNMALAKNINAPYSFYDKSAPTVCMSRFLPPTKILSNAVVKDSLLGDGCIIRKNAHVSGSVIGIRSLIGANSVVEDVMMMGSDFYEKEEDRPNLPGKLLMGVGSGTHIRRAIVDKNARIGSNCKLINQAGVKEASREEEGWIIKDGIIIIIKDSTIPNGTVV